MTEPQKEYIITEEQLKNMVENGTVGYSPYRESVANVVRSRPVTSTEKVLVYQYHVSVPSKVFPSIKRRGLALNDIGDNEDGFSRLDFELKNGDIIQVLRQQEREG